ncbi:MAG: GNAT family N-acetyltransferase [Odoribacter sp.]|nr:GNAT family N-acetyltransferase [Odoribacter sp.]
MEVIVYNSEWFCKLKEFLYKQYPHRSREYLDWWMNQMAETGGGGRTLLVVENETIYGCTTSVFSSIKIKGIERDFYWECNTIIDKTQRGKGLGKLLYSAMNAFNDRITVGFTRSAWQIQPNIIKDFKRLIPVKVYVSLGTYSFKTVLDSFFKSKERKELSIQPDVIQKRNYSFKRITDINNLTDNVYWLNDDVEIIRNRRYFVGRFSQISKEKYIIYEGVKDGAVFGYFVVRLIEYRGIQMLSLVDFRVINRSFFSYIRKAVIHLCNINKIGLSIMLTSWNMPRISFNPITLKLNKKLHVATSLHELDNDSCILITSADSDLDFVYYK